MVQRQGPYDHPTLDSEMGSASESVRGNGSGAVSVIENSDFFWTLGAICLIGSIEPRLAFISGLWCVTLAMWMN